MSGVMSLASWDGRMRVPREPPGEPHDRHDVTLRGVLAGEPLPDMDVERGQVVNLRRPQ
jgi:hypothetical protein